MSRREYFIRNAFIFVFMAFLWTLTIPFHATGTFLPMFIPLFGIATLFLGEVLWGEVVYRQLYPLRRNYVGQI